MFARSSAAFALGLAFGAAPCAATAPVSIHVGDGTGNGSRLRPYENAWLLTVTLPDGRVRPQGIWTDHLETGQADGRAIFRRVQGMTYVNGVSQSTVNTFDAQSCAPLATEGRGRDGALFRREFAGASITMRRPAVGTEPASTNSFTAPEPVFDFFGGMYGVLLACFPLRPGFSGSFMAVDEFHDTAMPVNFSVLRTERVRAGSRGRVEAMVAVVDTPGQYTETFWLSRVAPYVIRLEVTFPDHSRTMSFNMI